ncbi:MAG: hypothetical protein NT121_23010 [Chloroflexi bacterium]|nr:hypothetical protein [Chloroflexota bacterium]
MKTQLRFQAVSAALVSLLLIAMFFVQLPKGMNYPGLEVLRGDWSLSPAQSTDYLNGMQMIFALDGLFLAVQILAWVGIAEVVRFRSPISGRLVLIFGLCGAVLDLAENSTIWAALESLQAGHLPGTGWLIAWKTLQHLSYLFPMIGAIMAGSNLWGSRPFERLVCLVGMLFSAVAIVGLYQASLSFAPDLWYLAWFSSVALLLWETSALQEK